MIPSSYAQPSAAFKETLSKLPKEYGYILIFHLSKNNAAYILEWVKSVPVLAVISIPYSEQHDVRAEVEKYTTVYSPALADIPNCIVDVCTHHIEKSIITVEIGGYSASVAALLPNVTLAIEDTTHGHERFKEYATSLPYPVVSIARTSGKQKEDDPVGNAIAESVAETLKQIAKTVDTASIVVLGYGGVGKATAKHLRERGATVDVFDSNPVTLAHANADGYQTQQRATLLAQADCIVGCSGYQSMELEDLEIIKDGALLVSGSSKQVEFPYALIQSYAINSVEDGVLEEFTISDKSFRIAYQGQPINFYYDFSLGDIFDIPMTLLAQAVLYGTTNQLSPGLQELPS